MRKETIVYENYLGVEVKKDFYFNLSKAELMRMQMNEHGSMEAMLQSIVDEQDTRKIYAKFEELVQMSYGVISEDGDDFMKTDEILRKFVQSEAYSTLIMKLLEDAEYASAFVVDIFPKDIRKQMEENKNALPKKENNPIPAPPVK